MFTDITEALDYLYSFINLEFTEKKYKSKEYSLENINHLVYLFNIDLNKFKFIHIAGTKGKGSTTLFISNLLNLLGYSTTTFLSPHLIKPNERILLNLFEIDDEEIIMIINIIKPIIDEKNLRPTTFELFFLIFLIFSKEKKPDYLVVEVGLGGRLDTTNIIKPVLAVITPISFDHVNVLGKSLNLIAKEKAGIIKDNISVVVTNQKLISNLVISNTAKKKSAKIYKTKNFFKLLSFKFLKDSSLFSFKFKNETFNDICINILGKHQIENFFTALLSVFIIDNNIIALIKKNKIINIKILGRIQLLSKEPLIIVDVAHNDDSCKKLVNTLKKYYPKQKWTILSCLAKGKNYSSFYKILSKITDTLIITSCSKYKESEPKIVFNIAKKFIKNTILIENFNDAYDYIIENFKSILVAGSFYIAGPFIEKYYTENQNLL